MSLTADPSAASAAPIGPYSPGRWAGPFLFLSGRLGLDSASGELVGPGLREQGLSWDQVVKTTVFLTNMSDFADFNQIYAGFFSGCASLPARSCVQVAALPKGAKVEIEAVAYRQI